MGAMHLITWCKCNALLTQPKTLGWRQVQIVKSGAHSHSYQDPISISQNLDLSGARNTRYSCNDDASRV